MPVRFGAEPADEDDGHAKTSEDEGHAKTSEDEGPRQRRKCGEEIERKKDGVRTHELERSKGGKSTADARGTRATIMSTSSISDEKKISRACTTLATLDRRHRRVRTRERTLPRSSRQ